VLPGGAENGTSRNAAVDTHVKVSSTLGSPKSDDDPVVQPAWSANAAAGSVDGVGEGCESVGMLVGVDAVVPAVTEPQPVTVNPSIASIARTTSLRVDAHGASPPVHD
jgi:hypothetical protein